MSEKQRKYHDALDDALDRPIAYNPAFKRITASTVAGIFLSQAWYWSKRHRESEGWFYKSQKEWEDETGLTRSEQETARKHCLRVGVIEEKLKGVPATMYYRVNKPKVYELLGVQFAEIPQTENAGFPQSSFPANSQYAGKQQSDVYSNFNKESETPPMIPPKSEKRGDPLDGILEYHLKPKAIQDAIRDFFRLTPNWETKFNREFMQWAVAEKITPEQIKAAADLWRKDKRFNWSVPNLKGIHEHWLELMEPNHKNPEPVPETKEQFEHRLKIAAKLMEGK